jgi:hypothetical protein
MQANIDRVIAEGGLDDLASVLDGASASEIRYAARRLSRTDETLEETVRRAEALAGHQEPSARQVACLLISKAFADDADRSAALLERLLDDEEWTVRDTAATIGGRLLRTDFRSMIDHARRWRASPSPSVRRAAVVAAGRAAHPRRLEWAEPLLKLIEPLLGDRDALVRRALGPSALGTSLLGCYPRLTFEYMTQWSTSNDPQVLWNVAMGFSAPPAATMAKKALIILRKLSLDERRFVWRAVASAIWKLGRKCPDIVRPELARWLEDERRAEVAREALKHL